jgi:hypothetical protein
VTLHNWTIISLIALTLTELSFASSVRPSELIDRPIFTPERSFVIEAPQSAQELADSAMPLRMFVFNQALKSCALNTSELEAMFTKFLSDESLLWTSLDKIFQNSLGKAKFKHITILIDDFSSFAGNHPEYASYFIHDNSGPIIGLDCSSSVAESYWLPSLAHEFTHALLDGDGVESWWEEGIAQLMENDIGGEQPNLSLKHLERAKTLPLLRDIERPLPRHENYAISYLFVNYIRHMFNDWLTLSAMTLPSTQSECESQTDFVSKIACRGLKNLTLSMDKTDILASSQMTPKLILDHFWIALTLNDLTNAELQINEWKGFDSLPFSSTDQTLTSGQALISNDSDRKQSSLTSNQIYDVFQEPGFVLIVNPN